MRFEEPVTKELERLGRAGLPGQLAEQREQFSILERGVEGVGQAVLEGEEGARLGHPDAEFEVVAQRAQALPRAFGRGELELLAARAKPVRDRVEREQRAG